MTRIETVSLEGLSDGEVRELALLGLRTRGYLRGYVMGVHRPLSLARILVRLYAKKLHNQYPGEDLDELQPAPNTRWYTWVKYAFECFNNEGRIKAPFDTPDFETDDPELPAYKERLERVAHERREANQLRVPGTRRISHREGEMRRALKESAEKKA